jgi:hypothetical protein
MFFASLQILNAACTVTMTEDVRVDSKALPGLLIPLPLYARAVSLLHK